MPESPDVAEVVRRLGGRATTGELLAHCTRAEIEPAVRQGCVVRARRGVVVLPALPEPLVAAARARGVLSHASAARFWGLCLVTEPDAVHVTVPRGGKPPPQEGVRVHRSTFPPGPAAQVTPVLRTVLDCASALPVPEALAVADSALAHELVQREELVAAAAASSGPYRARRLLVARHADPRAANAFESCLRGIVLDAGLLGFEPQVEVRLPSRWVRVDLADRDRRLVLEADSFAHHGTRGALARDCERYDELVAEDWTVLRFAWEQVMFRQAWVAGVATRAAARRSFGRRRRPA